MGAVQELGETAVSLGGRGGREGGREGGSE